MWVVSLRIKTARILSWNTAAQAFPCVAIRERCTIRFDNNDLFPGVYACWIWCRWGANKLDIDDHMLPIGREVASLEGL
jgi:hypothetical protein